MKPREYSSLEANFPLPDHLQPQGGKKKCAAVKLTATQVPLISNNATTGHKLQGSSLDSVYVPSWCYDTNWPYVMLSRVRTLGGLYLGQTLDPSKDYSVPVNLSRMLRRLRRHQSPSEFDPSILQV